MRALLKKICLILLLFIASGATYQYIATKLDERAYPPPGKLIDIGGYRLHMQAMGNGNLTVVLDAGMACNSLDWALVQPEIAQWARVISYDRAGNGWSDLSTKERTSDVIAEELHTLLHNAQEKPPFILVGHSFGGINVRLFAHKYPDEVAAIILIDTPHEDHFEMIPTWPESYFEKALIHPFLSTFWGQIGLIRLINHLPQFRAHMKSFPEKVQEEHLAAMSTTKFFFTVSQEYALIRKSLRQLKRAQSSQSKIPLIVITAGKSLGIEKPHYPKEFTDKLAIIWEAHQKDLATKSPLGQRLIAEHSGHLVPHEEPSIIIESVKRVISK